MSKYGIPYKGNKSKIAKEILQALPAGERFVDLFGGGGAIIDCALREFPNKWKKFIYNDINPLLPELLANAVSGKYAEQNFAFKWISRDEFNSEKAKNGYIAYLWSFGNNGKDYLFGRDVENEKQKIFEYIVNGKHAEEFSAIPLSNETVFKRHAEYTKKAAKYGFDCRIQILERLESLSKLETLSKLESFSRFEGFSCKDYKDFKLEKSDVVYCDIPYFERGQYTYLGGGFDHNSFYCWAETQPVTIYYSNYTNGRVIWQKTVRTTLNTGAGGRYRNETLFAIEKSQTAEQTQFDFENQISIFDYLQGGNA